MSNTGKNELESSSEDEESGSEAETETEESSEGEDLEPWRHSVFGCCDHGAAQCCLMTICQSMVYGQATSQAFFRGSVGWCICCSLFGHIFDCCQRAKLRTKYGLEAHNLGGAVGDCMTILCCGPCARCQYILEIETRMGVQIGPCTVRRGDPHRPRGANTGGGMSRNSKVHPQDQSTAKSTEMTSLTKSSSEVTPGNAPVTNKMADGGSAPQARAAF